MPELIFNLNVQKDLYFEPDAQNFWTINQDNQCYVCDNYHLTTIMYDQSTNPSNNPDLIEINDPEFLKEVKDHVNESGTPQNLADVPIILGTLININGVTQLNTSYYSRKVKMLRAEFFSLLTSMQVSKFAQKSKNRQQIQNSIVYFTGQRQVLNNYENQEILKLLNGWELNLLNYVNENEVNQVFKFNIPAYLQQYYVQKKLASQTTSHQNNEQENIEIQTEQKIILNSSPDSKLFIYADFLKPGYHNFLIYDHATQRLFIKDLIIPIRELANIYPDSLNDSNQVHKGHIVNVWRPWIQDNQETEIIVFMNDLTSGLYEPQLVIKDNQVLEQIKLFQKAHRNETKIFYRELMSRSEHYPRLNFEEIYRVIKYFQTPEEEKQLPRAFLELSFQKSLRKQNVKLLKGTLCRAEFQDFLLRICLKMENHQIYQGYIDFHEKYIRPVYNSSEIIKHRQIIRQSKKLNNLLYKNKVFLESIFNSYKPLFTRQSALHLISKDLTESQNFNQFNNEVYNIWQPGDPLPTFSPPSNPLFRLLPQSTVLRCFCYSLMTVKNEQTSSEKYNYCVYVEFLEFICRVAINLYSDDGLRSVYEKTKDLLEILLKRKQYLMNKLNGARKNKIVSKKNLEEDECIFVPSDESESD